MWMNTSQGQSERPASSTSTRTDGSSDSRLASTLPADPPPTITKSQCSVTAGRDISLATQTCRGGQRVHSARELRSEAFEITLAGREARLTDLFEGFGEHDRLGVIVVRPGGALGASALITATITAFYDLQRARGPDFFIYPDYYAFHVGRPFGD